jgi:hypothetical protein
MALFTDGPISSIEDLTAQDSQLLTVASTEGIDVTQKLALAQDELGLELSSMITRLSYVDQLFWVAPQPDIGSVVVTPALRKWHTYRTLEMIYTDAYNSQLNDRYAGKRDQFQEQGRWAQDKLVQVGIGIVSFPIPQGAVPTVVTAPSGDSGPLPDGTYYVSASWANDSGEEGAASAPASVATAESTFSAQAGPAPQIATGWNVYVGTDPCALCLQNSSPIAVGQPWLQPAIVSTSGRGPGQGQVSSYVKPVPRMIQRG